MQKLNPALSSELKEIMQSNFLVQELYSSATATQDFFSLPKKYTGLSESGVSEFLSKLTNAQAPWFLAHYKKSLIKYLNEHDNGTTDYNDDEVLSKLINQKNESEIGQALGLPSLSEEYGFKANENFPLKVTFEKIDKSKNSVVAPDEQLKKNIKALAVLLKVKTLINKFENENKYQRSVNLLKYDLDALSKEADNVHQQAVQAEADTDSLFNHSELTDDNYHSDDTSSLGGLSSLSSLSNMSAITQFGQEDGPYGFPPEQYYEPSDTTSTTSNHTQVSTTAATPTSSNASIRSTQERRAHQRPTSSFNLKPTESKPGILSWFKKKPKTRTQEKVVTPIPQTTDRKLKQK
ncbi:MAG: hypothetical protein V4490_01310 [Pseudomonadota bacterium]